MTAIDLFPKWWPKNLNRLKLKVNTSTKKSTEFSNPGNVYDVRGFFSRKQKHTYFSSIFQHTFVCKFHDLHFSADMIPYVMELSRVTKFKVLFSSGIYVSLCFIMFHLCLCEFLAAILEKVYTTHTLMKSKDSQFGKKNIFLFGTTSIYSDLTPMYTNVQCKQSILIFAYLTSYLGMFCKMIITPPVVLQYQVFQYFCLANPQDSRIPAEL